MPPIERHGGCYVPCGQFVPWRFLHEPDWNRHSADGRGIAPGSVFMTLQTGATGVAGAPVQGRA
jgi:hypothetical protein